ncbi:NADH-quinone oxidoreductase subunit B family protein [Acidipila rosea]|uniref:Ni,Fe-hydrogenase III small subunit n=1 Tax=Acidipila rosea TaxID=768535 RepID=A0A4R1KWU0_9BACT|nr:formate hydrogenlyase [Acidipila rosea]MBW4028264.1 formate hydrogenlyase [Acidobacteriota bacterium]TCK69694.1 Ni,Fe-hydrogenase III small subunit [Acidipila rosea]
MFDVLSRMVRTGILTEPSQASTQASSAVRTLQTDLWNILGRALCIRHVDAGSCNGCELEIQALHNPYYNLEGTGIQFVASPRHADLLLVTGPVSANMEEALKRTYAAVPDPKLVVAIGDCGACGGIFVRSYASRGSIANVIPVNHTIPGCPPAPAAILAGIFETVRSAIVEA